MGSNLEFFVFWTWKFSPQNNPWGPGGVSHQVPILKFQVFAFTSQSLSDCSEYTLADEQVENDDEDRDDSFLVDFGLQWKAFNSLAFCFSSMVFLLSFSSSRGICQRHSSLKYKKRCHLWQECKSGQTYQGKLARSHLGSHPESHLGSHSGSCLGIHSGFVFLHYFSYFRELWKSWRWGIVTSGNA